MPPAVVRAPPCTSPASARARRVIQHSAVLRASRGRGFTGARRLRLLQRRRERLRSAALALLRHGLLLLRRRLLLLLLLLLLLEYVRQALERTGGAQRAARRRKRPSGAVSDVGWPHAGQEVRSV